MLVNLSWLKEFVPYSCSTEELCTTLTSLGLEVENISEPFAYLCDVYIGEVLSCEKHPTSEKLSVCTVSIGKETLTIVCGASNVRSGIRVPVATVGTTMPNGMDIKESMVRGISSCGMICSESELALGLGSEGIWILPDDAPVGKNLVEYFSIEDTVIELSITPNRADCLSILGIAREVARYYELPLTMPSILYTATEGYQETCETSVEEEYIPFYMVQNVTLLETIPTPSKIVYRLLSLGIRSISLCVDITNYVMIELGQPLHVFDADMLDGENLTVAKAMEQGKVVTLDGIERTIEPNDICIYDSKGIVAIAGILGCSRAEITEKTTKVLFESAVFDAISVRKTAKRLAISSQSSFRFERGVDRGIAEYALARAMNIVSSVASVQISSLTTKVESPYIAPSILFRPEKARNLLGIVISDDKIFSMLETLDCRIEQCDFFWKIIPPSYRIDLLQEIDFIEEIARLYGMDAIPAIMPTIYKNIALSGLRKEYENTLQTKKAMRALGLCETISYSFVPNTLLDELLLDKSRVAIRNPLSEEHNVLRTHLVPSLLMVLQHNLNRGNTSLALFEVGKVFVASADATETQTEEREMLGIILHGFKYPQELGYSKESWEYSDIKGIVTQYIMECIGVECTCSVEEKKGYLLPAIGIFVKGERVGIMGKISPPIAKRFDAKKDVWYAEISLHRLHQYKKEHCVQFVPLPCYPSISRDITFIIAEKHTIGMLFDTIYAMNLPLLEKISCLDIYIPEHTSDRHITLRIVLRSVEKTLLDEEADMQRDAIKAYIVQELGVQT